MHIAISITMKKYIAFRSALEDEFLSIDFLEEFSNRGYNLITSESKVSYEALKDNSGTLEIACLPKIHLCIKAINIICLHFNENGHLGKICIYPIATYSQLADVCTKYLTPNTYVHF